MMFLFFLVLAVEVVVLSLLVVPYAPNMMVEGILLVLEKVRWYTQRLFAVIVMAFAWETHKMMESQSRVREAKDELLDSGHGMHELKEKMFREQRNWYITLGAVIFYVLILRLEFVMQDRLDLSREVKRLRGASAKKSN